MLQEPPEDDSAATDPGPIGGAVALDKVTFRYDPDTAVVLDCVSISVGPGEFVAITGRSGAGKSTLIRLLLGFETPESGRVLYDGRNLADLRKRAIRAQMGAVLQRSQVPVGTILYAIVGDSGLPEATAWKAAEAAGAAEDIRALPMQMRTVLSQGSPVFSGGQLQRMCIARAIVHDPKVVLLDEATSTLDNSTQAAVAHALASLQTTRIVVAHRLSTIPDADRIYVLDRGRVVQTGTYDALIDEHGVFRDLAARQLVTT